VTIGNHFSDFIDSKIQSGRFESHVRPEFDQNEQSLVATTHKYQTDRVNAATDSLAM
jgi:hypothetical protein